MGAMARGQASCITRHLRKSLPLNTSDHLSLCIGWLTGKVKGGEGVRQAGLLETMLTLASPSLNVQIFHRLAEAWAVEWVQIAQSPASSATGAGNLAGVTGKRPTESVSTCSTIQSSTRRHSEFIDQAWWPNSVVLEQSALGR